MNEQTIQQIESSFQLLAPRGEELVQRFYGLLFARNPQLRGMFPADLTQQKQKLLASIVLVVRNIRTPENLMQPLREMGARHSGYGVRPEHYGIVRDTLLEVMRDMAGPAWNDNIAQAWTEALNTIATVMQEGAAAKGVARVQSSARG
jgi:methyl-accepting chemotaxis protein